MSRLRHSFLVLLALAGLCSCSRPPPEESLVEARDRQEFGYWRMKIDRQLQPQSRADFTEALDELKLHIMTEGKATGALPIESKLFEQIHGQTFRDVVTTGLSLKAYRLERERADAETKLVHNRSLRTREGDTESAHYLANLVQTQEDRLRDLEAKLSALESRLERIGISVDIAKQGPPQPLAPKGKVFSPGAKDRSEAL